jgi:hypothetical protein
MGNILELYSHHKSFTKVASILGISRQAATRKIKRALDEYPAKLPSSQEPIKPASNVTRVLLFCDRHEQPGFGEDFKEMMWLADLANDKKPHVIVDIGDTQDFLSLCSHQRNETWSGKLKPSLAKELEHAAKMYAAFNKRLKHKCRKVVTLGNHEHRLWTFENENPEMHGIPSTIYTKDILEASGWEWHKYGEYVNIDGVDFTHVPFNGMGKPVGGDNSCKQLAEKSTRDVVYGHTHALQLVMAHKFGQRSVTAFNGGTMMPLNYMPTYAKNTRKEFWHGCHILTIRNGKIDSVKSYSLEDLREIYSSM